MEIPVGVRSHMRHAARRLLLAMLLAMMSAIGLPSHAFAQVVYITYATLDVCNKGTVTVNVVVALENQPLPFINFLAVSGWKTIDPRECARVYEERGDQDHGAAAAFIGFGFFDAQNQFIAAQAGRAPDFGFFNYNWVKAALAGATKVPVLTKSDRKVCASQKGMGYNVKEDQPMDCASFHPERDTGPYFSFQTVFRFFPVPPVCGRDFDIKCRGGDYYLNIAP